MNEKQKKSWDNLTICIFYGVVINELPKSIEMEMDCGGIATEIGMSFSHEGRISIGIGQFYLNSEKWKEGTIKEGFIPMELPPSSQVEVLNIFLKKHDIQQIPNWILELEE